MTAAIIVGYNQSEKELRTMHTFLSQRDIAYEVGEHRKSMADHLTPPHQSIRLILMSLK